MNMAVTVRKSDGSILTASSWRGWRELAHIHMRRSCPGCDGEGEQHWMIVGDAATGKPTRWFPTPCPRCKGEGWLLP